MYSNNSADTETKSSSRGIGPSPKGRQRLFDSMQQNLVIHPPFVTRRLGESGKW